MAMNLDTSLKVVIMGKPHDVSLCYAEGMIGALPVFGTEREAQDFAGDNGKIVEIKPAIQHSRG